MFLTESVNTNDRIHNSDVTYSMELVQEASDAWNDLCDRMISLEHTAIVSEDATLLQEGKEEFKKKASQIIKIAVGKFMEWIEDVRIAWSQLVAKIRTSLLNPDKIQIILNRVQDLSKVKDKKKITLKGKFGALDYWTKLLTEASAEKIVQQSTGGAVYFGDQDKVVTGAKRSALVALINTIKNAKDQEITVDATKVKESLSFLKNRERFNKELLKWKLGMKKCEAFDSNNAKTEKGDKRLAVIQYHRAINGVVLAVNSLTALACRVCNCVKKVTLSKNDKKAIKDDYKNLKADKKATKRATRQTKTYGLGESVLNQFSL